MKSSEISFHRYYTKGGAWLNLSFKITQLVKDRAQRARKGVASSIIEGLPTIGKPLGSILALEEKGPSLLTTGVPLHHHISQVERERILEHRIK